MPLKIKKMLDLMKYNICCATDENYAQHCGVMLCSLFENNRGYTFVIHILISDLCDDTKLKLKNIVERYSSICVFYEIDESKLEGVRFRKHNPLTNAAYYRILLSSVIDKNISKILYLDSDIVVINSIMSVFDLNLDGYALAAVENTPIENDHRMQLSLPYNAKYFNSGVMFINLNYWRQNDSEKSMIEFAKKERTIYYHDQDALNAVFYSKWFSLPYKWNKFNTSVKFHMNFNHWNDKYEYDKHPILIHYASALKPWLNSPLIPYKKLYIKYLKLTPWKDVKLKKDNNHILFRFCNHLYNNRIEPFMEKMHLSFLCYPLYLLKRYRNSKKL